MENVKETLNIEEYFYLDTALIQGVATYGRRINSKRKKFLF